MKRRLAKLLMVVGALALVGAAAGAITLTVMIRRGFSARDQPSAVEAMLARKFRLWAIPSGAKALANPVKATPETLAGARAHFADHCALCHANDGSGDSEIGRGLFPKSPDMRKSQTQDLSDGELYYIIENGIRLSGMPAWGTAGHEDHESWGLVAFIRHLPKLTPDEIKEMEKLNPKSPADAEEDDAESAFLDGKDAVKMKMKGSHH